MTGRRVAPLAAAAFALSILGCGGGERAKPSGAPEPRPGPPERSHGTRPGKEVEVARCPAGSTGCETATGTILYVERVDPDGDGDAHFVLLDPGGITAPGLTVVDVAASLRPDPLPGPGDRISAAGAVHRGSYGQRQIEATELNVAR